MTAVLADFAFTVLISAHLFSVNLAMMAPLYSIWLEWRESRHSDHIAGVCGRTLTRVGIAGLLLGIGLGLCAIAWFAARGPLESQSGVSMLTADRWAFIAAELLFALVCMLAYLLLWNRLRHRRVVHRLIAVVAATNLIYHFPPLFVMLSVAQDRPEFAGNSYDHAVFRQLWTDSEVIARVVHHWFAAVAVGGLAVAVIAFRRLQGSSSPEGELPVIQRIATGGARAAVIASVLQIPVGFWLLSQLPAGSKRELFGGDPLGTGVFVVALCSAFTLMHFLGLLAMGQGTRRELNVAVAALVTTVVLMVLTLQRSRVDKPADDDSARRCIPSHRLCSCTMRTTTT